MKKNKFLLAIATFVLIILLGFFFRRFLNSRHRNEIAAEQVNNLIQNNEVKDGDIIFQTSRSAQSLAIQKATHSEYSHCGIVFIEKSKYFVFEAVQPVKMTPLDEWIARGKSGHFVIKRLKNYDKIITPELLKKMKQIGENFAGLNYDIYFDWSDDKIYCSELIWKIYKRAAGLEIGRLEKLRDLDLADENVTQIMKQRYGDNIPLEETVISPVSIFNSDLLITVKSN